MEKKPSLFVSYSLTKSADRAATESVVNVVKALALSRAWPVLDPMTEIGIESVRTKVSTALSEADCLIVEPTTSVPNVMFEVGHARALGLPTVFLVNVDAFSNEDNEILRKYFRFVNHDIKKPLPADVGDIEYFPYTPGDLDHTKRSQEFRQRLDKLFDHLVHTVLSPDVILLTRSARAFLVDTHGVVDQFKSDHPMVRFFSGWYGQLSQDRRSRGPMLLDVEAHYYEGCLRAFSSWDNEKS